MVVSIPLVSQLRDTTLYFLHIPKTAGTTLISLLDDHFHHDSICYRQSWDELLPNFPDDLSKFQLFRGHFGYGLYRILPKKPVYITFFRDPIERTISDFEHYRRTPHSDPRHLGPRPTELDFILQNNLLLEFLKDPYYHKFLKNTQTRFVGLDVDVLSDVKSFSGKKNDFLFLSYSKFLSPDISDENLLKIAKENLSEFAFVGITERFQESINLLCYIFGWKPMKNIPKLNIGKNRKDRKDFSKETIDKILEYNILDQELYEYAQKIFENRYLQMEKNLQEKYYDSSLSQLPHEELMNKLLERHYEEHMRNSNTLLENLEYDFRQPISGSGWYPRENHNNGKMIFRWTGPDTISTIDLLLSHDKDLKIEISVLMCLSEDILKSLNLQVNGYTVTVKPSRQDVKTVYEGIIQKSMLQSSKPFTTLVFAINRTISPNSINPLSNDKRLLGLAIDQIKITPEMKDHR